MKPSEQNYTKHIEELIELFFEGATSLEEEKELYIFFSSDTVPQELTQYKQLFTYFESELKQELQAEFHYQETESIPKIKLRSRLPKRTRLLRRLVISSSAALLLIFISVVSYKIASKTNSDSFEPYEGSFIIRDGVRITDINKIRPELEEAMKQALYTEHRHEIEFLQMEYERQNKYINFINSFPEGPEREAVMKTLQYNY